MNGLQVVLNLFSGLPNPIWSLEPHLASDVVTRFMKLPLLAAGFRAMPDYEEPLGRPRAGYRGFNLLSDDPNTALDISVYRGFAWDALTERVRSDPGRQLEAMLIDSIPQAVVAQFFNGRTFEQMSAPGQESLIQGIESVPVGLECENAPDFVGDTGVYHSNRRRNNCYSYATNCPRTKPGSRGATPGNLNSSADMTETKLRNALQNDGLTLLGKSLSNACPASGRHYLAVVLRRDDNGQPTDFHCLRLDSNGFWSHKDGDDAVTDKDNKGHRMPDLQLAKISGNPKLIGFFEMLHQNCGRIT